MADREQSLPTSFRGDGFGASGADTASLIHKVRNPLSAISTAAGLLRHIWGQDCEQGEVIEIIEREALRIEEILACFSRYVRPPEAERIPIDPLVFLQEFVNRQEQHIPGVVYSVHSDGPVAELRCDEGLLQEVFERLLENALAAIGGQGEVTLGAETRQGQVVLSIEDSGPGLGDTPMEKAFSVFWSSRPDSRGMGLPLASRLCQANDSELRLARGDRLGGLKAEVVFRSADPRET